MAVRVTRPDLLQLVDQQQERIVLFGAAEVSESTGNASFQNFQLAGGPGAFG